MSSARTFGRDGDTYGRHALHVPGGDNRQRDVLHVIRAGGVTAAQIHPTRYNADYVGAHRHDDADVSLWSIHAIARRAVAR